MKQNIDINQQLQVFNTAAFLSYLANGIIGPLFIVYLLSIGINPFQVALLLAIKEIAIVIFEFPTGLFADFFGRKISSLVSFFSQAILCIVWYLSHSFSTLIALVILGGIAYTFQSGAKDSLMIGNLNLHDNDHKRNYAFSRISIFGHIGSLLGGLIAAAISYYYIRNIWLAAGLLNLMLFAIYLFIKEKDSSKPILIKEFDIKQIWNVAKNNIKFCLKTPLVQLIMITLLFSLATAFYDLGYPIFFKQIVKIPNYYFGFLGSISAFVGILGAFLSNEISSKKGYFVTISFFALALFILYILFGLNQIFWFALIIFALIELFISGWFPLFQSFFNKFVWREIRASILSLNSTVSVIAMALGDISFGLLLVIFSTKILIITSGLLFLFIPLLLLKIRTNTKNEPPLVR